MIKLLCLLLLIASLLNSFEAARRRLTKTCPANKQLAQIAVSRGRVLHRCTKFQSSNCAFNCEWGTSCEQIYQKQSKKKKSLLRNFANFIRSWRPNFDPSGKLLEISVQCCWSKISVFQKCSSFLQNMEKPMSFNSAPKWGKANNIRKPSSSEDIVFKDFRLEENVLLIEVCQIMTEAAPVCIPNKDPDPEKPQVFTEKGSGSSPAGQPGNPGSPGNPDSGPNPGSGFGAGFGSGFAAGIGTGLGIGLPIPCVTIVKTEVVGRTVTKVETKTEIKEVKVVEEKEVVLEACPDRTFGLNPHITERDKHKVTFMYSQDPISGRYLTGTQMTLTCSNWFKTRTDQHPGKKRLFNDKNKKPQDIVLECHKDGSWHFLDNPEGYGTRVAFVRCNNG